VAVLLLPAVVLCPAVLCHAVAPCPAAVQHCCPAAETGTCSGCGPHHALPLMSAPPPAGGGAATQQAAAEGGCMQSALDCMGLTLNPKP
jgi:hypothetical protein